MTVPVSTSVHVQLQSFAVVVEDLDRAIDWWGRIFGFEVLNRMRVEAIGAEIAIIQGLGFKLELLNTPHGQPVEALQAEPPANMFAIGAKSVVLETSDLNTLTSALEEHGVTFLWREMPSGAGPSTAIRDSEGNIINIFQVSA